MKKTKKILIIIFSVVIIIASLYFIKSIIDKVEAKSMGKLINNIKVDESKVTENLTIRMLQLEELKKQNNDIVAWLEIENTMINYPILQTENNDYYMKRNYKGKWSLEGSLFLDKDFKWEPLSTNFLVYGHNNKDKTMFHDLLNYSSEDFYKEHKEIRLTTTIEDKKYEIVSVFYSKVYDKSENVFKYYKFINAENEEEFLDYYKNIKDISIYDTNVTAEYGDKLITLSTCEYSQKDGRFVVVARLKK